MSAHDTVPAPRPAIPPPASTPIAQATATKKYLELVRQLGAESAYAPGWRGEAARRLGISSSLLSQIWGGGKKITRNTLEKATISLRLAPDYFGDAAELERLPLSDPPPAPYGPVQDEADPLAILEAFRSLPIDRQRRLLAVLSSIVS